MFLFCILRNFISNPTLGARKNRVTIVMTLGEVCLKLFFQSHRHVTNTKPVGSSSTLARLEECMRELPVERARLSSGIESGNARWSVPWNVT